MQLYRHSKLLNPLAGDHLITEFRRAELFLPRPSYEITIPKTYCDVHSRSVIYVGQNSFISNFRLCPSEGFTLPHYQSHRRF